MDSAGTHQPPARHGFRRWRRTRPFWGGLFAVLGGLELIAIPLAPLPLVIHQGMAGVASWLIGALLVTAGVLMWVQPAQRTFYGVLAVLLALASFLTSNFGGFFVGLLLGLVGGALGFAWSPAAPARPAAPAHRTARHGGRLTAIALPAVLGLPLLAPWPTPPFGSAPTAPATTPSPAAPSTAPTAKPAPTPDPKTSAPSTSGGAAACPDVPANGAGLSQEKLRKLLQDLRSSKDPACRAKGGQAASKPAAGSGTRVYTGASTLRADSLTMSGLSYDGVASLPSAGGTVKALKFSMSKAVLKNVKQTTSARGGAASRTRTPSLTLTGDVVMYTTKMSSKLLGIPLTFTPESPPPLTLPYMVMTDVVSEQPSVTANGAQLTGLGIGSA
ncbi:hypothetical protein HUT06_36665 [Actinomadura sp. NAK00032]|uniref:DUF6114 domain-containing protein n=1 Tax=Actinomadura sp. NAK00032 TaxID=2742128 RepID=UPI0015927E24|nr:DUF6114 domain-containing protein [Actinomadura sp. NAK00032]QKW38881.1 hypothetical protein HUT06_36665 [Actinomadura sp. NAK00032]